MFLSCGVSLYVLQLKIEPYAWKNFKFQRIVVNVNETRLCAKLSVYSIAYNDIYIRLYYKNDEIVLAHTPILQVTSVRRARVLHLHTEKGYRDVTYYHITDKGDFQ
jgi:hypothetical protein